MANIEEQYRIALARVDAAHNRYYEAQDMWLDGEISDIEFSVLDLEFEEELQNMDEIESILFGRFRA